MATPCCYSCVLPDSLDYVAFMWHSPRRFISYCLFCFLIHFCYSREFFFKNIHAHKIFFSIVFYQFFSFINETLLLPLPKQ